MDKAPKERSLEQTPTWAVAVVCFVILVISIIIEHAIHLVGKWLKKKKKPALSEALEKVKGELMLMGFISLLLAVFQNVITDICISKRVAESWHPCDPNTEKKRYPSKYEDKCAKKDENLVAFVSSQGIHQLHIFIFVLAVCHIVYCITIYALGRTKMRTWKAWEIETRTIEYQYNNDPERFRFARETSFGRRHLKIWSNSTISLWIVCFFRQFYGSVKKVDYLTLRHGFITAHLPPEKQTKFDFRKYIKRSLDDDFKVVVGISAIIWFISVLYLLTYTHGWYSYYWLPFIPLVIILMVGTKLQVIITKMGLRIQETGDVVKGTPVVQPGDDLFWFGKPSFLLFLIHVVLFTNAFQLAFFVWNALTFSLNSCYHEHFEDRVIRVSVGVVTQVLCSYVTLPLYALVNQMGTHMRPTIFHERVATALKSWRHEAKKHGKHGGLSENATPFSSRPATPSRGTSPVHLLHSHPRVESYHTSPRHSNVDKWDDPAETFRSPAGHHPSDYDGSRSQLEMMQVQQGTVEESTSSSQTLLPLQKTKTQHEIEIGSLAFSFRKKDYN